VTDVTREAQRLLKRWHPRLESFLRGDNDGLPGPPWSFVILCSRLLADLAEAQAMARTWHAQSGSRSALCEKWTADAAIIASWSKDAGR